MVMVLGWATSDCPHSFLKFWRCFVFLVSFVGYLKGERTLKKCHIISIDYMVTHTTRSTNLPPCHDEEQESRTTLFKGRGDDVVQPTLSNPTYPKSPWTSKVNSFLYVNLDMTLWNGILLDHRHFVLLVMTSTTPREDGQGARGMKSDKTVAWKRRRKRR